MVKLRLDHVTAVVADVGSAARTLERLFGEAPIAEVTLPGLSVRTFALGETEIHLTAPNGVGPVGDHLRAHGPGLHHFAVRLDDLDAGIEELASRGFATLGAPIETAPGLREVFLDPRTTGGLMIQLVERRGGPDADRALDPVGVEQLVATTPTGR